jgi:hypothetical protein
MICKAVALSWHELHKQQHQLALRELHQVHTCPMSCKGCFLSIYCSCIMLFTALYATSSTVGAAFAAPQALQPMATTLKELRIRGAASLSQRALLLLSVLGNLETLELKNCGKVSWAELQEAWRMACLAYEAQAAEAATPAASSSMASKIGGWLPGGGRLFRTSSPCSSSIQSAVLAKQKSGGGGLLALLTRKSQAGSAAAVTGVQLGSGAVGNGRSSSGGGSHESGAVRKLLYRKQKQRMAAAGQQDDLTAAAAAEHPAREPTLLVSGPEDAEEEGRSSSYSSGEDSNSSSSVRSSGNSSSQDLEVHQEPGTRWSIGSFPSQSGSPFASSTSALYKVGSLVWQGTTAAAAALSSGSSIARQSSAVQTALHAYITEAEAAAELCPGQPDTLANSSGSLSGAAAIAAPPAAAVIGAGCQNHQQTATSPRAATGSSSSSRFSPARRRPSGSDKPLPAMPFTKLQSLSFTCSEVTLKNPACELAALASLTSLTCLEMGKCKLPDSVLWRLTSLKRLRKLKLSGLWSMGNEGIAELAKLTTLKSFALSEAMHATAAGLLALSQLTGLTGLSLGLTQDLGPGAVARVVASLPGLQCAEVTASCWCDVDCELLAQAAAEPNLAAAAAAAAAIAQQQAPIMLWNVQSAAASMSRSSSSKLMHVQPPLSAASSRSNSSLNLRAPSFGSTHSFGSFSNYSLPAAAAAAGGSSSTQPQPVQQQLVVLKLHGCSAVGHAGLAALKQLKFLQVLVLDGCKNIHAGEAISQDLLPPQLTSLSLHGLPFGNVYYGCVNMPACSSSMVKLELSSVSGTHRGQLRRVLSFFPKLRDLSLAGSVDIEDAAMCHLQLLPQLTALNLSGTRVSSTGVEQLAGLQELRVLSLKACSQMTDAALQLLAMLPALQELDVSECGGVSEQGLKAVMKSAPALVQLDVCGCKGMSLELVQACPHYLHLKHSL